MELGHAIPIHEKSASFFTSVNTHLPLLRQAEKLNYPSVTLVDEYGVAVTADSLGASGPIDLSYPAYIPMYSARSVVAFTVMT